MVEDGEWDERLKNIVKANWMINPWGRSGKFLALDEFIEEIVRNLKGSYNPGVTSGVILPGLGHYIH